MTAVVTKRPALSVLVLIGFLTLCWAVAWLGSIATMPAIPGWYATLEKPSWTPPNWLFGPVWSLLYTMMAVSAWLIWRREGLGLALALFFVQLFLNALWSWVFFDQKQLGWAVINIALLWGTLTATLIAAWRVTWLAGALLIPYLLWVSYATALNFAIWQLN